MAKPYHRKELVPTIVPEAPWTECNPPVRPKGCSLEFWGGAVAIDRSLRIFDVATNQKHPPGLVARADELTPKDRLALAAYMQALWGLFANAAPTAGVQGAPIDQPKGPR